MSQKILLLITFSLLCGCGSEDSSFDISEYELIGNWSSECGDISGDTGVIGINFNKLENGVELQIMHVYYNEDSCSSVTGVGGINIDNYKVGRSLTSESGNVSYELDMDLYSRGEYFQTFKTIFSPIGTQLFFGLPSLEDECDFEKLTLGRESVLCSKRPTRLNFDRPYNEQV